MKLELKKRIITSFFLLSLLILMYFYSFVLIIALIVISLITWIEFYGLISKIFSKDNFLNKLIFSLNCEELIHLQTFTDYFGINSLNEKINIVLDLIRTSMDDNGSLINMREPLSLYL